MKNQALKAAIIVAIGTLSTDPAAAAEKLTIVGTGDGLEMLRAVAVAYSARNPDAKISIPPSIGSGGGIAAVGSNTERLGRVARPLKASEIKYGLVYVPFAKIPSAFFTHPSTKVDALSSDDLVSIYSGRIKSWSELGGADLKVKVVRREESDSTLQILRKTMPGWADFKITPRSKTAVTTQDAISTVRSVAGTIGFGPYSRPLDFDLNVVKVDGKFPTDPAYPSAVTLALIYKQERLDDQMKSFVDFCLSDAARTVIENYGGVPIRH